MISLWIHSKDYSTYEISQFKVSIYVLCSNAKNPYSILWSKFNNPKKINRTKED